MSLHSGFLFAVNAGNDDISVFRVDEGGRLDLIEDTPFPSGGKQPSNLVLMHHRLCVVNCGDGILPAATQAPATGTPGATNYTGFRVNGEGEFDPIPGSTIVLAEGSSPTQ